MKAFLFFTFMAALSLNASETTSLSESERLDFGETVDFQWQRPENPDSAVYLGFDARIDAGSFTSGGAPALQVLVNRVPVTLDRLMNKQTQWIHGTRRFVSWGGMENMLMVLYHTWEDEVSQYGRLHRYVFDITSLLKPEENNHIEFKSTFAGMPDAMVEMRDIHLQVGGKIERHPLPSAEEPLYLSQPLTPFRQKAIALHRGTQLQLDVTPDFQDKEILLNTRTPLKPEPVRAAFGKDGALRLEMKGFSFSSHLNVGLPESGWKKLEAGEEGERMVYADERIRIEREIVPFAYGVSIRDRVTNLTAEDLPVGLLYEMELGEQSSLEEFRLFGGKQGSFYANSVPGRMSAITPSLFFRNNEGSVGFLIEDDILRNQASYLAWDDTMAFGTDMFYLKGGASHEFLWSVIPTNEGGYYDFLNKVRAKWNTYQEIPGLFGFVYPEGKDRSLTTPEKIREFLDDTGITNPCLPPSTEKRPTRDGGARLIYGNEPASIVDPVLNTVGEFTRLARDGGVEYPFLLYTDVHAVRTDGDQKILDELSDSVVLDYRGNPVEYHQGWLYILLSTENTSAGTRFLENLQKYMAVPGVQGIFLDEWDHSRARYSFNHPDDNTALLDENFQITRKIGIVPLLIRSYQKKVADFLLGKNAVLYANQFDSTQDATALPIVHFAEPTQYDSYLLKGAQLSRTPLSLTVKRSADPWLDAREFLKQGVLMCFYAQRLTGDHMLKHIYPITARKIGPGYVIGDDRIVTLRSGRYAFGDERPLQAKIFGGSGGHYLRTITETASNEGVTWLDLRLNEENQEAAVIEPASDASEE